MADRSLILVVLYVVGSNVFILDTACEPILEAQVRAAWSSSSTVRRNNFGLVKLLIGRWRLAVPLPLAACLAHIHAPGGQRDAKRSAFGFDLFAAGAPLHSPTKACHGCLTRPCVKKKACCVYKQAEYLELALCSACLLVCQDIVHQTYCQSVCTCAPQ